MSYPSRGAWRFRNQTRSFDFWPTLDSVLISEAHPEDLATFSCSVVDRDASLVFEPEDKVWVTFAGTRIFAGHLKAVEESQLSEVGPRMYGLDAQDYTAKLDDSVAVWLNDLGNGPPHSGTNVPWLLAGSAGGFLRTGQYLDLGGVTINRVLNTILSAVGVRNADGSMIDDFGDSSLTGGLIDEIVAT